MGLIVDKYVPGEKGKEVYASPLLASHFDGLPPACKFTRYLFLH